MSGAARKLNMVPKRKMPDKATVNDNKKIKNTTRGEIHFKK